MFWTNTINEGQSKKRFFFSRLIYVQVFIERSKDYGSLVLRTIKKIDNFFKRIFLYSHLSCKCTYIFIIWIYFTLAYLYIYIFILKPIFSFSLTTQHTRQTSVNERQWYQIACLTETYVIIICLCIVCPTYFIFVCI